MTLGWPPSRRRGIHFAALGACLGAVSVSFVILGRDYSAVADEAQSWPSTRASVWKSQRVDPSGGVANDSPGFEIGYLYQVGDKTYSGGTLTLGTFDESETTVQSLLEAFPVGRKITIYYDPANPQRSVVWRGKSNVALIARLVGATFAILAATFVWRFVRRWRATSPASRS